MPNPESALTARAFIPESFEDLTPAYLTRALRTSGALSTAEVSACRVERIGVGQGFAAEVARLHLEYRGGEGPAALIAKLPSADPRNRALVESLNGYEREVCFYRELAARSRADVPRCYAALMDDDPRYASRPAWIRFAERIPTFLYRLLIPLGRRAARSTGRRYFVLVEDVTARPEGAPACGDQVAGCDTQQALRAVRALAAFHASYWGEPSLAEKIWLLPIDTLPRTFMAVFRRARRAFLRDHAEEIPHGLTTAVAWTDAHFEALMKHLAATPQTVVHGDFRLDNLFFTADADAHGPDPGVTLIDFQVVLRGRAAVDLAYFIGGSVPAQIDEGILIEAYVEALARHGVEGYGRLECERDYAIAKLYQMYVYIAGEAELEFGDGRGPQLLRVIRERHFARIPPPPYAGLLR